MDHRNMEISRTMKRRWTVKMHNYKKLYHKNIGMNYKKREAKESFLLLCTSFDVQRPDLLAGMAKLLRPFVQITDLSNDALTQLLLYPDQDLS